MNKGYDFAYYNWMIRQPFPELKRFHIGSFIIFGNIQVAARLPRNGNLI